MNTLKKNIEIKLLADCPEHIPYLSNLWYQHIGKQWVPNASIERSKQRYAEHLNRDKLPLTLVAIKDTIPVGMASLRERDSESLKSEFKPWLGSLVVDEKYRHEGIGQILIDAIKDKAKKLNYFKLYLLTFDLTLPSWYAKLGWQSIGTDQLHGNPITIMRINL